MQPDADHEHESPSRLKKGFDFEDLLIEEIINRVEINLRNMAFAMQMVDEHGFDRMDRREVEKLQSIFSTFYTYVDDQMDVLTRLRRNLDTGEFSWLSINKLRASNDFRPKMQPEAQFGRQDELSIRRVAK